MSLRIKENLTIQHPHLLRTVKIPHRQLIKIPLRPQKLKTPVIRFMERHIVPRLCGGGSDAAADVGVCVLGFSEGGEGDFGGAGCEGDVVALGERPAEGGG